MMQECFLREWNGSVYLIKGLSLEEVERKMYVHILAGAPATQRYAQSIRDSRAVNECLREPYVRDVPFTTIE
jgi:hypothetical protein